ncbi:YczE/YyaS/YitT family protein [Actinospongicola halichondriae]|uniref:membrane protein YczE n=1 Tax=Actinospongicola halichondriae TaxID=3236844 RepID=UPI003D513A34
MLPRPRLARLTRCFVGLVMLGVGLGLTVAGDIGLSPWDVLHQGLSERFDISIGTASIGVGVVVLLGWVPLRERPGLGTVMNVFVIGIALDLTLLVVDTPDALWARVAYLLFGVWLWGPGSGLYIGSGLGPGPRDGLMTGLARRGLRVGPVRSGIELSALALGFVLGGTVGVGTIVFALGVGPNVAWWLPRLTMDEPEPRPTRANLHS